MADFQAFTSIPLKNGLLVDLSDDLHPTKVFGWGPGHESLCLDSGATHYGFVCKGNAEIEVSLPDGRCFRADLVSDMYFASPYSMTIHGGQGVVISRLDYSGFFTFGGPIEKVGRLRYIDGCSDSLLISPVVKGDPCLNLLHFPKSVQQTSHTHPSIRVGIIARGRGKCVAELQDAVNSSFPLEAGTLFLIPAGAKHGFFTDDSEMDVIAYHPDSDTGPDHDDHPMVNRTMVDGVKASAISSIRTAGQ